jgi:sugar O-acyltransferase (sialic acid O-acetyltransferase NeuD family)
MRPVTPGASKQLIILGTGGNCVDILDTIREINARAPGSGGPVYECLGFLDDEPSTWGVELWGVKVLGRLARAGEFPDAVFVNGIGSERNFWRKAAIIAQTGLPLGRFETVIHPTASVSATSILGAGVVIFQNVTVTTNVTIGDHVIVLPNSVISHDVVVGEYTCIAGGVCVSGGVRIGRSCYLGTNSAVISNVAVGDFALVGMGSVVLGDVAEGTVVVGNPARYLRRTREEVARRRGSAAPRGTSARTERAPGCRLSCRWSCRRSTRNPTFPRRSIERRASSISLGAVGR